MMARKVRQLVVIGLIAGIALIFNARPTAALQAEPSDRYYSPLYITVFGTDIPVSNPEQPSQVGLQFFELKNTSSQPLNLAGWELRAYADNEEVCIAKLDSWILGGDSVVAAQTGILVGSQNVKHDKIRCNNNAAHINSLLLSFDGKDNVEDAITIPDKIAGAFERRSGAVSARTGVFTTDFKTLSSALTAGEWYVPVTRTPLRIVEVLAHSRNCSPAENFIGCQDHVKLYNPSGKDWTPADGGVRLRMGYAGQNATTSNAIVINYKIPAKAYVTITSKADGSGLSITDSGGWVWLEGMYGIGKPLVDGEGKTSVVEYPSASSKNKIGWVWAHNPASGAWHWTAKLTASDQPSEFYIPPDDTAGGSGSAHNLTPCRADQFRNPLTNRCKLKASASSSLKPCAANQYRSPETNRCRLLSSKSAGALKPCASNQYRNPETNRCRLIASTASSLKACAANQFRNPLTNRCKLVSSAASSLKPCLPGQERNPATNRCRKSASATMPTAGFPVETTGSATSGTMSWLAFAGVSSLAVGYGAWEWRRELGGLFAKAVGLLKK